MLRKKLFRIGLSCAVAAGMLLGIMTVTHAAERVVHLAGAAKSEIIPLGSTWPCKRLTDALSV